MESNVILPEMLYVRGGDAQVKNFYGFDKSPDTELVTFTEDHYVNIRKTSVEEFACFLNHFKVARPDINTLETYVSKYDILSPADTAISSVTTNTAHFKPSVKDDPIAYISPIAANEHGRWLDFILKIEIEGGQRHQPPNHMYLQYILLGGAQNSGYIKSMEGLEADEITAIVKKDGPIYNELGITGAYSLDYEICCDAFDSKPTKARVITPETFPNEITKQLKDNNLY